MSHVTHIDSAEIVIRAARAEDMTDVARVVGRDNGELPAGRLLVARVDGDVRAAVSLSDGTVVADPFHRTVELVKMLRIRAEAAQSPRAGRLAPFRRVRRAGLDLTRAA